MPALGREAMALACEDSRAGSSCRADSLVMAVNVSAAQIYEPGFVEGKVIALLARTGAPANASARARRSLLLTHRARAIRP